MKRLKNIFPLVVLACIMVFSAQAQDKILTAIGTPGQTRLEIRGNVKSLDFTNTGGTKTFSVKTNTTVKPKTDAKWITPSINNETGEVSISVGENTGRDIRTAVVTLAAPDGASKQVNVAQLGTLPAFIMNDDTVRVKGNSAGVTLNITANNILTFKLPEWITPKDIAGFNGTKNYTFVTDKMEQGTRYGEITVNLASSIPSASKKVVIEQTFEGYPTFIVMSDIHFGASGSVENVSKSLQNIYSNTSDVDAVIFNGDLTNNGNLDQYNQMLTVTGNTDILPEYISRYYVMGNHEWYTTDGKGAMNNYNSLGAEHYKYFDIKGYPFIYIGMSGGSEEDYSAESLDFLKKSLDDAVLNYPGKPIFVFQHIPAYGTVQGSNEYDGGWGSKKIYDILKDYPQVFDFSGHTHFSSRCPLTFNQNRFTSLNDGGNLNCYVQKGIDVDGEMPEGCSTLSEGMIVTVEDENNISVRRIDGARNEDIGDVLNFPAPYDGTNFTYANYRGSKPVFENTEVKAEQQQPTQRKVTFPQASVSEDDPNNIVLYYKVEIVNSNDSVVAKANRCSRFYLGSDMPETLDVTVNGINGDGMMRARVTAVDPYGNESDPIESDEFEQGEYKPAEGTEIPVADLFDLSVDEVGKGSDKSEMLNPVITSETTPIPFYDADYKLTGAKFNRNVKQYYAMDYSDNGKIKTALTSGFTMEAFFLCTDVDGIQSPMSTQQDAGMGFWMDNGLMHFYAGYGDKQWYDAKFTQNIQPGKYYHAVATYDGEKIKLYLNGYPAGELNTPKSVKLPIKGSHYLVAGGDVTERPLEACDAALNGYLMIARLYSRAVTRDEDYVMYKDIIKNATAHEDDGTIAEKAPVADLFNIEFGENGTATDVSEQSIPVKVGKTVPETYYNETYKRWAAKFPGNDQYCYFGVPYNNNDIIKDAMTSDFTLEALCVVNNDNLAGLPAVLSSQGTGGVGIEPGEVIQGWGYFSGSYATVFAYDYPVQKNTYYHIVLVVQTVDVDNPTMSIYVDGKFAGKTQLAGALSLPQQPGNQYFCIGGDASNGDAAEYLLNGEVAVARMYSRALTLPEIKRLFVNLKK